MDNRRHRVVDSRVTLASGGYGELGLPSLNSLSDSGFAGMDWSLCRTVARLEASSRPALSRQWQREQEFRNKTHPGLPQAEARMDVLSCDWGTSSLRTVASVPASSYQNLVFKRGLQGFGAVGHKPLSKGSPCCRLTPHCSRWVGTTMGSLTRRIVRLSSTCCHRGPTQESGKPVPETQSIHQ